MLSHCSSRVLDGLASVTSLRLQSYGELVTGGEVELVAGGEVELVAGGELGVVGGGGGGGILKSKCSGPVARALASRLLREVLTCRCIEMRAAEHARQLQRRASRTNSCPREPNSAWFSAVVGSGQPQPYTRRPVISRAASGGQINGPERPINHDVGHCQQGHRAKNPKPLNIDAHVLIRDTAPAVARTDRRPWYRRGFRHCSVVAANCPSTLVTASRCPRWPAQCLSYYLPMWGWGCETLLTHCSPPVQHQHAHDETETQDLASAQRHSMCLIPRRRTGFSQLIHIRGNIFLLAAG